MRCEKAGGEKLRLSDSKLISGPAVNLPSASAFIEGKACCAWYYRACGTSWVFLSPFSHTHTAHTHVHMLTLRERGGERERVSCSKYFYAHSAWGQIISNYLVIKSRRGRVLSVDSRRRA